MNLESVDRLIAATDTSGNRSFLDCLSIVIQESMIWQNRPAPDDSQEDVRRVAESLRQYLSGHLEISIPTEIGLSIGVTSAGDLAENFVKDFLREAEYPARQSQGIDLGRWAAALMIELHESEIENRFPSMSNVLHFISEVLTRFDQDHATHVIRSLGHVCVELQGLQSLDWTQLKPSNGPGSAGIKQVLDQGRIETD